MSQLICGVKCETVSNKFGTDKTFLKSWNQRMKCLFFMYSFTQQVLCIPYLSSFFTSPGLSFCQMHILFPFLSGFVEICCSAFPFLCPSPLFKRNSRISSLLFIVCSAIPLYQLQFWATEVISFCIGGSEEQRYVRPRAAYLSNANRLDLSKSHWNHITYSSSAKYLQNEEGVKTGETNISVFFLSPHGQTPFYPLTFVFAWQRVRPSDCDSPEWAWGCGPGSGLRGKTACLCRCCSCGTDMEPV